MQKSIYDIIVRPLQNEKSTKDADRNAYHFEVDMKANKIQIKAAVEKIYAHKGVKVLKVCTITKHPKVRRFRFRKGHTRSWKKAIVYLDKESKLELF